MQFLFMQNMYYPIAHCSIIQRFHAKRPKTPSHYVNTIGMRSCLATTVLVFGLVTKTTIPASERRQSMTAAHLLDDLQSDQISMSKSKSRAAMFSSSMFL